MRTRLRVVWLSGVCAALAAWGACLPVQGQTPSANVAGRWTVAFDTVDAEGSVHPDQGLFLLQQAGDKLSGTAGPSEEKQAPITTGEVHGQNVDFTITIDTDLRLRFQLQLEGSHLHGSASGLPLAAGEKIVVDAVPWPQGATPPQLVHAPDGLFATVSALDTKLFDAYNHCDLTTMGAMVTDDLEFYHDKTGLAVGKQPFVEAIKNNICGKTQRTLVPGSMEVYPLKGYGAVEIGVHRFSHPGHPEFDPGEAKFITVWQNKDGVWKISREISYDHQPLKQ